MRQVRCGTGTAELTHPVEACVALVRGVLWRDKALMKSAVMYVSVCLRRRGWRLTQSHSSRGAR